MKGTSTYLEPNGDQVLVGTRHYSPQQVLLGKCESVYQEPNNDYGLT